MLQFLPRRLCIKWKYYFQRSLPLYLPQLGAVGGAAVLPERKQTIAAERGCSRQRLQKFLPKGALKNNAMF
jgi:hypothetical protein